MNIFQLPPVLVLKLFLELVKKKLLWLAIGFTIISLVVLPVAFVWPKIYTSSTTILADKQGVLAPLMEGAAVTTGFRGRDRDRIDLYKEILFGTNIMHSVVVNAGWINSDASEVEKAREITSLIEAIDVTPAGPNLIRIEVEASEPERAYLTAKILGDEFIKESLESKQRESRAAYEFVDKQVQNYHKKLLIAEKKLQVFKTKNVGEQVGSEKNVFDRVDRLRAGIEELSLQIQEQGIRQRSLSSQLAGERQFDTAAQNEGGLTARIAALEQQLAVLRLDYHDTYPDIVRIKYQIEDLKKMLATGEGSSVFANNNIGVGNLDTVYGALRDELVDTRTNIAGLSNRLAQSRKLLAVELERAKKLPQVEAELAELTRDYNVTNDVYQDLVLRRENARVSMNIDVEQSNQRFAIQEPALLPITSDGVRFFQVAGMGPVLGLSIPLGILLVLFQLNANIRHKSFISKSMNTAVLGEIPFTALPSSRKSPSKVALLASIVAVVAIANIYLIATYVKMKQLGITLPSL